MKKFVSNPVLQKLEQSFPELLISLKSKNTITYEIKIFPAKDDHGSLFLVSLIQSAASLSKVTKVFYGLKFIHNITSSKNPCKSQIVKSVYDPSQNIRKKSLGQGTYEY